MKINSAKLSSFRPADLKNLFCKNFCPRKFIHLRYLGITFTPLGKKHKGIKNLLNTASKAWLANFEIG